MYVNYNDITKLSMKINKTKKLLLAKPRVNNIMFGVFRFKAASKCCD